MVERSVPGCDPGSVPNWISGAHLGNNDYSVTPVEYRVVYELVDKMARKFTVGKVGWDLLLSPKNDKEALAAFKLWKKEHSKKYVRNPKLIAVVTKVAVKIRDVA